MFYNIVCGFARFLLAIVFNMKYEGKENLPKDKGFILTGNHRSFLDAVFVAAHLPVQFHVMAKEELFKYKIFAWFFSKLNAFPVARGTGDTTALDHAQEIIDGGGALLMFIEGTRGKSMTPARPRSGTALMAARTGAPVVATSIEYGEKLKFRSKVIVRFHPPIYPEELGVELGSPKSIRTASKKIMSVIISGLHNIPKEETEFED